ncbi:Gfo/Idh/MocA family protein [Aestuariivirga sp.]|uniref:Gfo/Idh/MocA family protein n=1 Tax=Aestuariivirga sp. TaxID=2650926 RepID=UPI00391D7932
MAFRLGIIGLGKIAQDQHLPVVAKNPDFELAAVVSSRGGHGEVPAFRTPAELFRSGLALDAVSLCMPPEPRYAIARDALDAGLHVLMEKPPTPTVGELDAIAAHARTKGRILFTTWHSQYNAAVDEAKRLLAGKAVSRLHVSWKEDVRHWHPGQEWIWEPGGFGVFDPGINAFSIVTKILPQPIFVATCVLETPENKSTPIAAKITFKPSWEGEAKLTAELDWRQTGEQSWNIDVETADGLKLQLRKGGTELHVGGTEVIAAPMAEYEGIYAHFAELLRSGRSHVDGAPLRLVSDCFMLGRRRETEAFF